MSGSSAIEDATYDATPPEFVPCESVIYALARADSIVRRLGQYSTTREGTFWTKRQERLIARAYECRG